MNQKIGFFPGFLMGVCSSLVMLMLASNSYSGNLGKEVSIDKLRNMGLRGQRRSAFPIVPHSEHIKSLEPKSITKRDFLLLILIHSTPLAIERRRVIRRTWLNIEKNKDAKFVARFVIGTKKLTPGLLNRLASENERYGDLVLLANIMESAWSQNYSSSRKMLESFNWAYNNVYFSYILKCSDSTFVVLKSVLSDLKARKNTEDDLLWGYFVGDAKVNHKKEKDWFLCTHYLPYPQGGGYVISHELVSMLSVLHTELEHYEHDDIALGVWVSPYNGIEYRHDVRFNTGPSSRGCNNKHIVTHRETAVSMLEKYTMLKTNGQICAKENSLIQSYYYNWKVPSNRCCIRKDGIP